MPKGKGKARGNNRRGRNRKNDRMSALIKAVTDLKVATALHPTPRVMDVPRIVLRGPRTYTLVTNFYWGNVVTSASSVVSSGVYASLNQIPQASSLQTIFDSWRVLQMTVRFVPLSGPNTAANPPLLTVIDYDDANALATTSAARAYDTVLETPFSGYVERTVNPKVALAAFSGAFTSYAQASKWIDCASPSVQWYGVKYAIDVTAAAYSAYDIEVDVVMQFKSVR